MLWSFLELGKIFQQPFAGNALQTSFNCGELNVGQQLLSLILEADPDAFSVLMQENADATRNRTSKFASATRADAGEPAGETGDDDTD